MTTNTSSAKAEGLPEINRRRFLRDVAIAGAVATVATEAAASQPEMTPREQAIWHMRELERLAVEDGGNSTVVQVIASYGGQQDRKLLGIHYSGRLVDFGGMFAAEGGAA